MRYRFLENLSLRICAVSASSCNRRESMNSGLTICGKQHFHDCCEYIVGETTVGEAQFPERPQKVQGRYLEVREVALGRLKRNASSVAQCIHSDSVIKELTIPFYTCALIPRRVQVSAAKVCEQPHPLSFSSSVHFWPEKAHCRLDWIARGRTALAFSPAIGAGVKFPVAELCRRKLIAPRPP